MEQLPPLEKMSFHAEVSQQKKVSDLLATAVMQGRWIAKLLFISVASPSPELLDAPVSCAPAQGTWFRSRRKFHSAYYAVPRLLRILHISQGSGQPARIS